MMKEVNKKAALGKLGPKASRMTWEKFTQPAVFEIVCEPSGRRFIGCSMTPNLRRSTYFFQLKNVEFYDASNVFFGVKAVLEDLEKHGFDSFYFEIVRSMPDATEDEVEEARDKYIKKFKLEQLYNRRAGKVGVARSVFTDIDEEMAKLESRRTKILEEADRIELIYQKTLAETRKERRRLWGTEMRCDKRAQLIAEEAAKWRAAKRQRDLIRGELSMISGEIVAKNRELIKKYSRKRSK